MGDPSRSGAIQLRLAVIGALVFFMAGCTTQDSISEVRPFAEVQASPVTIEFSPAATSAVLRVDTSLDMVCAVAYGSTMDLGLLATDDDMAGGAHANHGPTLRGLEPDTEYFYRLQGVAPDGGLYQSDVLTFVTPAAAESAATGLVAVTGARVVQVSSEFSSDFSADNAVDGDAVTEWSSSGDGDDAYIVIEFDSEVNAQAVEFVTRSMGDGSATAEAFTITVDDVETYGPFSTNTAAEVTFTGTTVRFDVDSSTGGNTGAVEVSVYVQP